MKSKILFFIIFTVVVLESAQAQTDCSLRKDSQGIKVYSCNIEGSKVKRVRAVFELEADFNQIVAAIYDVPSYTTWQYHMISSKLIDHGMNELTYYSVISAPWPVSNRDMIVNLKFKYDSIARILEITGNGVPTKLPAVEDKVRVPYFKAKWTIQKITNGKLQVEYNLDVDIGGSIPAWLMNMAQAEGPFETFNNLKDRLKLELYNQANYPFLNEKPSSTGNR